MVLTEIDKLPTLMKLVTGYRISRYVNYVKDKPVSFSVYFDSRTSNEIEEDINSIKELFNKNGCILTYDLSPDLSYMDCKSHKNNK